MHTIPGDKRKKFPDSLGQPLQLDTKITQKQYTKEMKNTGQSHECRVLKSQMKYTQI